MEKDVLKSFFESFSIFQLLVALIIIVLTWIFLWGMRVLSEILASKFTRYRLFISSAYPVLRLFVWVGVLAFVIFAIFNPPYNAIFAITASVGLAIGLGAQDLIKNVIAGILILLDRPFRVGDMIQVENHYGEVRNIGLRSICLQTFDDSSVTLPNALVLGVAVANSNTGALDELVVVEFDLPACTDVQQVKELAREAAACSPYLYLKKPIAVMIEDRFERTFLTRIKIKAYVLSSKHLFYRHWNKLGISLTGQDKFNSVKIL
jgi:small-conductance mechanosensitive channel